MQGIDRLNAAFHEVFVRDFFEMEVGHEGDFQMLKGGGFLRNLDVIFSDSDDVIMDDAYYLNGCGKGEQETKTDEAERAAVDGGGGNYFQKMIRTEQDVKKEEGEEEIQQEGQGVVGDEEEIFNQASAGEVSQRLGYGEIQDEQDVKDGENDFLGIVPEEAFYSKKDIDVGEKINSQSDKNK